MAIMGTRLDHAAGIYKGFIVAKVTGTDGENAVKALQIVHVRHLTTPNLSQGARTIRRSRRGRKYLLAAL
jgi:hypothetical protein